MSSKDRAIADRADSAPLDASGLKFGIVVAQWNDSITSRLLEGCKKVLQISGADAQDIKVLEVPGSFELIGGMSLLLTQNDCDAVIGLGCVIKGETRHDEYINHAVAQGLIQLNIKYKTPTIFGLLTVENRQQAEDRAGGKYGNKGEEAAETAIVMARLYSEYSK